MTSKPFDTGVGSLRLWKFGLGVKTAFDRIVLMRNSSSRSFVVKIDHFGIFKVTDSCATCNLHESQRGTHPGRLRHRRLRRGAA